MFAFFFIGVATFVGCPAPIKNNLKNCNGALFTYEESQTIRINVSLEFSGSGSRNKHQTIDELQLKHPNNEVIARCDDGVNCDGINRISFEYSDEGSVRHMLLENATMNDTGVYVVEAEVFVASNTKETIRLSVTVNVTASGKLIFTCTECWDIFILV